MTTIFPKYLPNQNHRRHLNDNSNYVAATSNALWNDRITWVKSFLVKCNGGTNLAPKPFDLLAFLLKLLIIAQDVAQPSIFLELLLS